MLRQLSSSHDNGQSMAIHPKGMKHALSVVYVSSQRAEHGYLSLTFESCSVSCHRLMTTVRALCMKYIIYPSGINHASSVVIVS